MLLGYLSYVDIRKREVPDLAVLALFLYSFFVVRNFRESIVVMVFVFILNILIAAITDGGIGGGDIKLMSVLAFLMGDEFFKISLPMFMLMLITSIYCLVTGKGIRYSVPLVPYIFLSLLAVYLVELFRMNIFYL